MLWLTLVADCLVHAKGRHSFSASDARKRYEKYKRPEGDPKQDEIFRVVLKESSLPVGREVVLGRLLGDDAVPDTTHIMEFYRFDDECQRRLDFARTPLKLANGIEVEVLRRAATFSGIQRQIDLCPSFVEAKVVLIPINSEQDYEIGPCADRQRMEVRGAIERNPELLRCLSCDKPVSTDAAPLVERDLSDPIECGVVHDECLRATDRIIGRIEQAFFKANPVLVNFDAKGWFEALQGGQQGYRALTVFSVREKVIAWGGRKSEAPAASHMVESLLENGESELVHLRNAVQKFTPDEARKFANELTSAASAASARGDPLCYSDQSKTFGPKSLLTSSLAKPERLRKIVRAIVRPYDRSAAARYNTEGNWYAPVAYLRVRKTDGPLALLGVIPLFRNPEEIEAFLANWRDAKIEIPEFEVVALLNDRQFDDFADSSFEEGFRLVIEPVFAFDGSKTSLVGGTSLIAAHGD